MTSKRSLRSDMFDLLIFAVLLILFASQTCVGQETTPFPLSLRDAVVRATTQNPNTQIARMDTALANEQSRAAFSSLLPQVSIGFSDSIRRINVDTSLGTRAGFLPEHEGPFQALAAGTRFTIPIFNASDLQRYRASKADSLATLQDARTVREEIGAMTVAQYLLTIRLAAVENAINSQVTLAQRLYEQATHLEDAGAGTGLDTLRANQKLKVQQQALLIAQEEHTTAEYGLVRLLNLPPGSTLELTDASNFDKQPLPNAGEYSVASAIEGRPGVAALGAC